MVRLAMSSVADLCILPMQDLLGLGSEARMNRPATAEGNWDWRMEEGAAGAATAARLRGLTVSFGRALRGEEPAATPGVK
jgi:4-alpha-glucanotransferase